MQNRRISRCVLVLNANSIRGEAPVPGRRCGVPTRDPIKHVISVVTHLKSIAHRFRSRPLLGAVGAPIASLLLSATALALPPNVRLSQIYHTGWTAPDGAPTGIESMGQTCDGYLWLGNSAGLFQPRLSIAPINIRLSAGRGPLDIRLL